MHVDEFICFVAHPMMNAACGCILVNLMYRDQTLNTVN